MPVVARIKNLDFNQFIKLFKVFIFRPLYVIPTIKATAQTVRICDQLFREDHHKNNPENAFRHAFWNYLICEKCIKFSRSAENVIGWSKNITDIHEQLCPNSELAKAMDLHNNNIGRVLFRERPENQAQAIEILKEKMKNAAFVTSPDKIKKAGFHLVFIENEE